MKVVAFNGSPRPNGNTQQMIEAVFETLRGKGIECERVDIARKPLRGCTGCYGCTKNGGFDLHGLLRDAHAAAAK